MSSYPSLQKFLADEEEYLERRKEGRERESFKERAEKYFELSFEDEKNFDKQTIIKLIKIRGVDRVVMFLEFLSLSKFQDIYSQFSDLEKILIKEKISEINRIRLNLDRLSLRNLNFYLR